MSILVTGGVGFIGMHVVQSLLSRGEVVVGVDSLNDCYDVSLKEARLAQLNGRHGFTFERLDVADMPALADCFLVTKFDVLFISLRRLVSDIRSPTRTHTVVPIWSVS